MCIRDSWGFAGMGVTFNGNNVNIEGCTFGGNTGYSLRNYADSGSFKSNLVITSESGNIGGANSCSYSFNSFSRSAIGSNQVIYQDDLLYLLRVEDASNRGSGGESGDRVGAHIINRVGTSGALYGESGWNTETNVSLWPWPYETEIREWFRETNVPPSGASPLSNDSMRGFCANGQTLTKYIWEYLGNDIPADVYSSQSDTTPPNDVTDVVSMVNEDMLALSWVNPSDADFAGTMVRYGTNSYPVDHTQGNLLCDRPAAPGSNDSYTGSLPAGTYYLSIFTYDQSGNFSQTVHLIVEISASADTTPPTGSVVINAGAAETESPLVNLTLSATDAGSGVTQMQFSNDGGNWSAAETYSVSKSWTLSNGLGFKTVYVRFKDGSDNWSVSFTDTINLVEEDTTAPAKPSGVEVNIN